MPTNVLGTLNACFIAGGCCRMSYTNTYSLDCAAIVLPSLSWLRLNPLVRMRSVFPSGLTAVETGWSTVNAGRSGRPGFNDWKTEPGDAVGVMTIPVGSVSPCDEGCSCANAREKLSSII